MSRFPSSRALASLCVAFLAVAPLAPAPASAEGSASPDAASASGVFDCAVAGNGGTESVVATLSLSHVPARVRSGEDLALEGTMTFRYSNAVQLVSKLSLAKAFRVGETKLSLVARTSRGTTPLPVQVVSAPPVHAGTPFDLPADVSTTTVSVPSGLSGAISLELPSTGVVPRADAAVPEKAAFTTEIVQDSLVTPKRKVECWLPDKASPTVLAKMMVDQAATTPSPSTAPDAGTPAGGASLPPASAVDPLPQLPGVGPSAPVLTPPVGDGTAAQATLVNAAIPRATVRSGTFIPAWDLTLMGAILVAWACAGALVQRRRLRQARRAAQVTPTPAG